MAGIAMFDDTIDLLLLDIMLPKIDGYGVCAVSYTHLDVYKRQRLYTAERDIRAARLLHSGRAARAVPLHLLQPRACGRHRFSGGEVI